jgi:hypothetical protein
MMFAIPNPASAALSVKSKKGRNPLNGFPISAFAHYSLVGFSHPPSACKG